MKIFLKKLYTFIVLTVSVLILVYIVNKLIYNFSNLFVLNKSTHTLVLGDSHACFAINDNLIPGYKNLSKSGDSYFYSYLKAKEIFKRNSQIDTLILSIGSHNINAVIEDKWLFNEGQLNERLPRYTPFFSFEDLRIIGAKKPMALFKALFKQLLFPLFVINNSSFGQFKNLEHNILNKEIEKKQNNTSQHKTPEIAYIEKHYLLKIKDLCEENSIEFILIITPLHQSLQGEKQNLYEFCETNLKGIQLLDFSRLPYDNSYFGDLVHLSPKGAQVFSESIALFGLGNFAKLNGTIHIKTIIDIKPDYNLTN